MFLLMQKNVALAWYFFNSSKNPLCNLRSWPIVKGEIDFILRIWNIPNVIGKYFFYECICFDPIELR